jgi:hypothetical protein
MVDTTNTMGSSVAALQLSADAGAPEHEIEITAEMISAGADVLWRHPLTENLSPGFCEDLARLVLARALRARQY